MSGTSATREARRSVTLDAESTRLARQGVFVRAEMGSWLRSPDGLPYRSAFVARIAGRWVAYANVCRHHPVEMDVPDMRIDPTTQVRLALVGSDGQSLMCASHGALYRARDGYCFTGPCSGQSLVPLTVTEMADGAGATAIVRIDATVADESGPPVA